MKTPEELAMEHVGKQFPHLVINGKVINQNKLPLFAQLVYDNFLVGYNANTHTEDIGLSAVLFARYLAMNYEGHLNSETGNWYCDTYKYFQKEVLSIWIKNGKHTKEYLDLLK